MKKLLSILLFVAFLPFYVFTQGIIVPNDLNITVNSGSMVIINDGLDLLVKADANGTGSVIDMNTDNAILFAGGGKAKVELFLEDDKWHYVASPVELDYSACFYNIYLKKFLEPEGTWEYIVATNTALNIMQGYAAWAASTLTGDVTVTFSGLLNAGSYSRGLTHTGDASHNSKGFNMVGNPYASAVDWDVDATGWTRTNVDPTIYLYNSTNGQYGNYNRSTLISVNDVTNIIPPKQGFFVHVTSDGTGTLGINNNARIHDHKAFFKSSEDEGFEQLLRIVVDGNSYHDECVIYFDENATPGFDGEYDAFKLEGKEDAPQLYLMADEDELLSVNTFNNIVDSKHVPMFLEVGAGKLYMMSMLNIESFSAEIPIYLEDTQEGIFQNMRDNNVYEFFAAPDDEKQRFIIHFALPDNVLENMAQSKIHIYSDDQAIHINLSENLHATADVYNIMGQMIVSENVIPGLNVIPMSQSRTNYVVKVTSNEESKSQKVYVK